MNPDEVQQRRRKARRPRALQLPDLSPRRRIGLLVVGWLLILLGVLGLFLPILQGVLLLALGAATLSLVSERAYWVLRWFMTPCPKGWRLTLRMRRRLLRRIRRRSDLEDEAQK